MQIVQWRGEGGRIVVVIVVAIVVVIGGVKDVLVVG